MQSANLSSPAIWDDREHASCKASGLDLVAEVDKISESEWTAELARFEDASIYQTWSHGRVFYGSSYLSHLVVKDDGEIVAMAQIGIKPISLLRTGMAYVHWGPVWRKRDSEHRVERLAAALSAMVHEYSRQRRLLVRIWPCENAGEDPNVMRAYTSAGFAKSSNPRAYRTLRISLLPSLDELRKNLGQKWRNQLNKAEKIATTIIEGTNIDLYDRFWEMHKEMRARKKFFCPVDLAKYRELQRDLPETFKMTILIGELNGEAASALVCACVGNTGIYLLGASSEKGFGTNISNLLHWRMIQRLRENGCTWYDLGGIDPEGNPGVYSFKTGISGKSGQDVTMMQEHVTCNSWQASAVRTILAVRNRCGV